MNKRICKYCNQEFDVIDKPKGWMANHSRWCDLNPKIKEYNDTLSKVRATKKNFNNQFTYGAIVSDETKEKLSKSNLGKTRSEETKSKIRKKALESKHRRLKKGTVEYKGILLDSSWELALAKRLDELGITWIRPEPLSWEDDDKIIHNYFPDFYLPDYDIYLDPKNSQALKVQKKKVDILLAQYKNIVILETLDKCKTFTV